MDGRVHGQNPDATLSQILRDSKDERQYVYRWLFRSHSKYGQDNRIRTLLEQEAFQRIAKRWQRLGYPFDSLTPSYATAIGASGDRPAALAELAGIILSGGMATQTATVRSLDFAANTPYESRYVLQPEPGKRLLAPEITELVRRSMLDVVERGTAKSIAGAFVAPGKGGAPIPIAGKTGTGDQRFQTYGPGGRLISSRSVNRSATFVFTLGERFFGTVTLNVSEPYAARYSFTSALAVRVLRYLAPQVASMTTPGGDQALLRCRDWPQEIRLPRTEAQAPPPDGATASADVVKVDQPLRRTMP